MTPGGGVYLRGGEDLRPEALQRAIAEAERQAEELDERLHANRVRVDLSGRSTVLVDDGLATGATMIAAVRWARLSAAARVLVAVPVAATQSAAALRQEADEVVCLHELDEFFAVDAWYRVFDQVSDAEVLDLLEKARA